VETREVAEGLIADLDAQGQVVGFGMEDASARFDLTTLETSALPFKVIKAA
jgi:uncharacterized protein YuzE